MPRDKDLKRLVRTRMQKTGESYTTARSRIVGKTPRKQSNTAVAQAPLAPEAAVDGEAVVTPEAAAPDMEATPPLSEASSSADVPDYAKIAGMSDDALKAKTGCDWERWVYALDRHRAHELSHREIADIVNQKYGIDGWWSQCVTVGYERIKGLRERGQRRGGGYEASKSKTVAVPVEQLYDAWAHKRVRKRWLTDADPKVRAGTRPRTLRLGMEDGSTVALWFTSKGNAKSSVAVQHLNLPDRAASDRSKKEWGARLDALAALLRKP
jgi:hypothetical protein